MPYTGSPPSFSTGEKTGVAAKLNQLRDAIRGFTDPWSSWTPTVTQGATVTWSAGSSRSRYLQVGKLVHVYTSLAITGAGTAGQVITVTLPVNAVSSGGGGGSFQHFDTGNALFAGWVVLGTSSVTFSVSGQSSGHGIGQGTLSNGDTLNFMVTYEAA